MRIRSHSSSRPGISTTATVLLLLVPFLGMVAFAFDLNYVWRAEAELQNAADGAAHAAAAHLMGFSFRAAQPGLSDSDRSALLVSATSAASTQAVAYGQKYSVADDALVVSSTDVELGFIADPRAAASTTAGQFQTGPAAPFPNSVRVTVRRDGNVSSGPLKLFFGPVVGTPSCSRTATATATLRGQNVTGFNGSRSGLLPLAMSQQSYTDLMGATTPPAGVLQDNFTMTLAIDGGSAPPNNVTAGADGIKELSIYPDRTAPDNFGLISLTNRNVMSGPTWSNWIINGPSAADLATFGANGLQASAGSPATCYGGPGMTSSLMSNFASIIGQPRVLAIAGPTSSNGGNTTCPVYGFTGAVIVSVNQGTNKVTVQLCSVVTPAATLGAGPGPATSTFIYRGVSLTR